MIESFKEFLKKKSWFSHSIQKGKETRKLEVKDLGEWAFERFIENLKSDLLNEVLSNVFDLEIKAEKTTEWLIAVACLGEQEIKKRLKELRFGVGWGIQQEK